MFLFEVFSTENGAGRRKGEAEELTEVRGATTGSSNLSGIGSQPREPGCSPSVSSNLRLGGGISLSLKSSITEQWHVGRRVIFL